MVFLYKVRFQESLTTPFVKKTHMNKQQLWTVAESVGMTYLLLQTFHYLLPFRLDTGRNHRWLPRIVINVGVNPEEETERAPCLVIQPGLLTRPQRYT